MAATLDDPNNHAPPVSAADVWDDCGVVAPARAPGGLILPGKRMAAGNGQSQPAAEPTGLRIEIHRPVRSDEPTSERPPVAEYGGAVIKLEHALDEGPFQAAKVIPAMELTAREDPRELHGEGREWGKSGRHSLRWLVAAGSGVAILLVAALTAQEFLLAPKKKPPETSLELIEEVKPEEVKGFEYDGPTEANARLMTAAYAKAKSPAEVAPLLRDAARLTPRLLQDWQPWQAPPDWQPAREAIWQVTAEGGRSHGCLRGRKPDFSPYKIYFIREGDALQIDWEATEGLGDAAFDTLQRGTGSGGITRAFVTQENFYSLTFPEAQFRSYKLLSPDREQIVWGYVKADSAAAAALHKIFEAAGRDESASLEQPMTLRLTAAPAGAQKNQWLIGEMLHIDWVSP